MLSCIGYLILISWLVSTVSDSGSVNRRNVERTKPSIAFCKPWGCMRLVFTLVFMINNGIGVSRGSVATWMVPPHVTWCHWKTYCVERGDPKMYVPGSLLLVASWVSLMPRGQVGNSCLWHVIVPQDSHVIGIGTAASWMGELWIPMIGSNV